MTYKRALCVGCRILPLRARSASRVRYGSRLRRRRGLDPAWLS